MAPLCVYCPPRTLSDPLLTESWCSAESGVTVRPLTTGLGLNPRLAQVSSHSDSGQWSWSQCPRVLGSSSPGLPSPAMAGARPRPPPPPARTWSCSWPPPRSEDSWPARARPPLTCRFTPSQSQSQPQPRSGPGSHKSPTIASLAHKESTQCRRFFLES